MSKVEHYVVIEDSSIPGLEELVNEAIKDGYVPSGSMSMHHGTSPNNKETMYYFQPMIKYED